MAEISASIVKALREKTGAGMMECKKALVETSGDSVAAEKILKERGLAAMEKRADRITSEGRIFIKFAGGRAVIAELTCETDFVAKNADFIKVGEEICDKALAKGYGEVNKDLSDMLIDLASKIRENMTLRRIALTDIPTNAAASRYLHFDGKTGVITLIACDPPSAASNPEVKAFAYDCCLHQAAFTPLYNTRKEVPESYIAEQKAIFDKQAAELDKPDKVKAGIAVGKLNKHLAEICFMDQLFVKDDKMSVAKKMEEVGKKAEAKLSLAGTVLWRLGM
ncbi:MAG: translation elongation factor Ts [Spirochaetaceae bacterium]|jgi:elongation factor Ts|nr:translation elongation factor Ts [Spirochaetaceae bacterium]